ncbi:MAG TPA: DinB family protein [Aggregatilineaceae bacterium]|nr:DinB family protein [Aggregatilineaceae bacterium]
MSVQNQAVTTLACLSNNAFDGRMLFSLLANLKDLRDEDWETIPAGGERSIVDIVDHVGSAKWMYQDHAFGAGTISHEESFIAGQKRSHTELIDWLLEGHRCWIDSLSALTDDQLDGERLLPWGETMPLRTIIHIVIAHDTYHAGEINHLRALLQGNDHW